VPAAAAPNGPVIQDGIDAKAKGIFTEAAGEPMLTITGGTLEVAEWIWWGDGADSFAMLDMSGGTVSVTDEFELGWGGGAGTLTITGGTINAGEAVIPTGSGAFGHLNLNGGTYNVTKPGGFEVNATGMVDITGGTLVLEGDETTKVNDLIAAGQIKAYGGAGQIAVDFDVSNPGKTTVTAVPPELGPVNPSSEGLVAHYAFENDLADSSGNGLDGTAIGDPVFVAGVEGMALDFNGDDYVDCGGVAEFSFTDAMTVSTWVNIRSVTTAWMALVAKGENAWRLGVNNTTTGIHYGFSGGTRGWQAANTATELALDEWYHVAATYDTTVGATVYINGKPDASNPNLDGIDTNAMPLLLGENPEATGRLLDGILDEIKIYNRALSEAEIRYLSGERSAPVDPGSNGLLACYPLDGDANDISGNGINGTIFNADTGGLGEGGSVWVDDPEHGTVISFNGTAGGAYVRAGEIPQMTLTNDFTWAFWAKQKAENTADNDIILGNRMNENAVDFVPRQFIKFTPTKFEWHMNGNGNDNLDYDDIPADIWLHHAVVKTGDQLTYYRNGVESSTGTITQPLDFPQPLFFGGDNEGSAGENWNGLMSDVCIYGRALSEGEIRYLAGERAADPSLVIYYSFDEVGDIIADQSGKGHDGVVVGDVTAEANGMYGGAANLANTGYLNLDGANFPAEDIPTSGFTLAAWTNIDGTSNQNAIFNARASDSTWLVHPEIRPGDGDYRFTVRKYGGVTIGNINGGTPGYKKPEGTPVPNEWVHVAMTFSRVDAQVILYVNGQVVAQAAITEDTDMAGDWGLGARVGYNIDDARHYTGLMDEFRMYTRALSQDEILDVMAGM
jgi:hypothetical protein